MSSKKWCITALSAVILALLVFILLNVFVDPFGIFGSDWYSYSFTNNPRVAKTEYLKKYHGKYDSYIIGSSSTSSYPVDSLNEYLDASFYNLIMYGSDMKDVEDLVYHHGDNYETKNILINIYILNGANYDVESDRITGCMHPDVDGSSKLGFYTKYLFADPRYSFAKLDAKSKDTYLNQGFDVFDERTGSYDKRRRDAEHISDLGSYYEAYPVFKNYPYMPYNLSKYGECADSLSRISDYCESKGINLILVGGPVYNDFFCQFSKEEVLTYYKALCEKVSFWDFSVSSVSTEPRYFYDDTHFRNDVGEMILAKIFGNTEKYVPEDFGTYITKENVQEYVESLYGKVLDDSSYTQKLPVLLYHHIDENPSNDMIVSPSMFEAHMKALSDAGFNAVSAQQVKDYILGGTPLPQKPFLITFDDGYYSNYEYAYPILEKYGYKGIIFAVGETFGEDTYPGTDVKIYRHFGMQEMLEMENSGVMEVQSHSYGMHQNDGLEEGISYVNMCAVEGEGDEQYALRLKEDYSLWCEKLGKKPFAVAFPHGKSEELTQVTLNECGVNLTFSTEQKTDTLIKGLRQSGYSLGRLSVTEALSPDMLVELLNSQY